VGVDKSVPTFVDLKKKNGQVETLAKIGDVNTALDYQSYIMDWVRSF